MYIKEKIERFQRQIKDSQPGRHHKLMLSLFSVYTCLYGGREILIARARTLQNRVSFSCLLCDARRGLTYRGRQQ